MVKVTIPRARARLAVATRGLRRRTLDVGQDLMRSVTVFLNNNLAVLSLVLVFIIAATHSVDKTEGMIHDWAKSYPNNKLLMYMSTYIAKLLGLLAFVPVVVTAPRRSYPVAVMAVITVAVLCLEEANFYQYLGMAAITHVYVQAILPFTKTLAMAAFAVYIVAFHSMLSSIPPVNEVIEQAQAPSIMSDKSPGGSRRFESSPAITTKTS